MSFLMCYNYFRIYAYKLLFLSYSFQYQDSHPLSISKLVFRGGVNGYD